MQSGTSQALGRAAPPSCPTVHPDRTSSLWGKAKLKRKNKNAQKSFVEHCACSALYAEQQLAGLWRTLGKEREKEPGELLPSRRHRCRNRELGEWRVCLPHAHSGELAGSIPNLVAPPHGDRFSRWGEEYLGKTLWDETCSIWSHQTPYALSATQLASWIWEPHSERFNTQGRSKHLGRNQQKGRWKNIQKNMAE